jgi:tRNA A-37 threonylcarbamoyl transferase component Bud32
MAFVDIEPGYRELLARQGLATPTDFFDWQGVLIGGHADRHIARVTVGEGEEHFTAYLKREERVRWRHRLNSFWQKLGFVSRCVREGRLLRQLRQRGIACPEVIAAGESAQGGAFLLVREVRDATELRQFLSQYGRDSSRRKIAVQLGRALAAFHAAGFYHGDLYAKHVLVREDESGGLQFAFVDWQRARHRRFFSWSNACADLAALDATLAEELASPRERLACLAGYLGTNRARWRRLADLIRHKTVRLLRRRRISEMRQPLLAQEQSLVRDDQAGISLTGQFREDLGGRLPVWLRLTPRSHRRGVTDIVLSGTRQAALVRGEANQPFRWLWGRLRGKPLLSPEVQQAGTLFRLERYGIRAPRLLAFGQQARRPWQVHSLLLMEKPGEGISLAEWLRWASDCRRDQAQRRHLLRKAGDLLRRLHAAACYLPEGFDRDSFRVHILPDGSEPIALAEASKLRRRHRPDRHLAAGNLAGLKARFTGLCSRTDTLRVLLAYLAQRRLTPEARRLVRRILRPSFRRRVLT